MHVRAHQVVELVQHAVDHLDEQVALLVLERGRHEQRQDVVEERPRPKLARLVRELAQRLLAHGRSAVLDLEQQLHDLALARLVGTHVLRLLVLAQQRREELIVLRLHKRQAGGRRGHVRAEREALLGRQGVERRRARAGGRRGHELASGRAQRHVAVGRLENLEALGGEHCIQILVRQRPIPSFDLACPSHLLHRLGRHVTQPPHLCPKAAAHGRVHVGRLRVDRAGGRRAGRHRDAERRRAERKALRRRS